MKRWLYAKTTSSMLIALLLIMQFYLMIQNLRVLNEVKPLKKEDDCAPLKIGSIQCTPRNHRLFPLCEEKFQALQHFWPTRCFKDVHGVDGSNCSILGYLSKIETYCPPVVENADLFSSPREIRSKLNIRTGLDGFVSLLSLKSLHWLRQRSSHMWADWTDAAMLLKQDGLFNEGYQKKILFYLGSMAFQPFILENAGKGGFVGELVQWTDLMVAAYILGHDVKVIVNNTLLKSTLTPDENGCASKTIDPSRDFDLIFTDFNGIVYLQQLGTSNFGRLRCKLRTLDSFGTEAEFNYFGYGETIPGGRSGWASKDLLLPQILTYFPHSPDNTFLGFVGGTSKSKNSHEKKNQAVIYGKNDAYLQGRRPYLDVINKYFEIHATMTNANKLIPSYVINHGILGGYDLKKLLQESKLFIGLGFPYEGPGPIDAIANGAVFLNPKFDPPRNKFNDAFFKDKPTLRKLSSQNPYLEEFVGEPYVYTVNIDDVNALEKVLSSLKSKKSFPSHIPRELTHVGMLEKLHVLIQHQNFCDMDAPRWPPLNALFMVLAPKGTSCKQECHRRGLICESTYFTDINNIRSFERLRVTCKRHVKVKKLYHPSYDPFTDVCFIQDHFMYFSCVAESPNLRRICPCRDFHKGQVAICRTCLQIR